MGSTWKFYKQKSTLKMNRLFSDHVYWECTQRLATVDRQTVQSKTELFKKLKAIREADETCQMKETYSLEKITARSCGYGTSCRKCIERYCESAKQDVSTLQEVATPCIDDDRIPPKDYETTGEHSSVCAHVVLRCLYFGRNWTTRCTMVT